MKSKLSLLLCLGSVTFVACKKGETPPPPAPTVTTTTPSTTTEGGGYVGTMLRAQQSAIKTVDLTSLNNAIMQFNVAEGRYPKDLNELVSQHYIALIPAAPVGTKLVYDADSGKVTTAPQ